MESNNSLSLNEQLEPGCIKDKMGGPHHETVWLYKALHLQDIFHILLTDFLDRHRMVLIRASLLFLLVVFCLAEAVPVFEVNDGFEGMWFIFTLIVYSSSSSVGTGFINACMWFFLIKLIKKHRWEFNYLQDLKIYPINRFKSATFFVPKFPMPNSVVFSCVQWFEVRDSWLFCWYLWNFLPPLYKLSSHDNIFKCFFHYQCKLNIFLQMYSGEGLVLQKKYCLFDVV